MTNTWSGGSLRNFCSGAAKEFHEGRDRTRMSKFSLFILLYLYFCKFNLFILLYLYFCKFSLFILLYLYFCKYSLFILLYLYSCKYSLFILLYLSSFLFFFTVKGFHTLAPSSFSSTWKDLLLCCAFTFLRH